MSYPHGHRGQRFPQQPPYPQQPWAPQPDGPPPQPPAAPNGATAIIAGVLASLGAVSSVVGGLLATIGIVMIVNDSPYSAGEWSGLFFIEGMYILAGVLLAIGAVLLFLRRMASRWLIVAGCAVIIVGALIDFSLPATVADYDYSHNAFDVLGLVFPIATLVLVVLPSTAAWLRAKRAIGAPQHYPPPHPG